MRTLTISLCDLEVNARIGVDPQERIIGNDFRINIAVTIPADHFKDENLDTSVSYVVLYDVIHQILSKEWLLLESVAKRIGEEVENIIDSDYIDIEVSISKLAVPIAGMQGRANVIWRSNKC